MAQMKKCARLLVLLLLLVSTAIQAQTEAVITVVGSGVVNPALESMAAAADATINIETTGSAAGIDRFCNGDIDLATTSRAMTGTEAAICAANEVDHSEFRIGHQLVAFIAHPDAPPTCLWQELLSDVFKPTASNQVSDWSFADPESDLPLTLFLPPDNDIAYTIIDGLVPGDGLRVDGQTYSDRADAIAQVSETAGALAIVSYLPDLATEETISLLEFGPTCELPAAASIENDSYPAALSFYVYLNRTRLEANAELKRLMQFIFDEANQAQLTEMGITAPTSATYSLNAAVLADATADPDYVAADAFVMPATLTGEVKIVGAANAFTVLDQAGNRLTGSNEDLTITQAYAGDAAGLSELCSGDAHIAVLNAPAAADALADCAENDWATHSLDLGAQATVLLGNAADAQSACLTSEQIHTIWRAESAETILDWSALDAALPEQALTLFGLQSIGLESDILLQGSGAVIPPIRRDTEQDYDPLYRAAAVANVPGALTYMTWADYGAVLDNDQARIQLVAVDNGAGCVLPASATVADGSYALTRSASLLARDSALADVNVQAFLWTLFADENWPAIENAGFIGLAEGDFPAIRSDLQDWFAQAEAKYPPVAESEAGNAAEQSGTSEMAADSEAGDSAEAAADSE